MKNSLLIILIFLSSPVWAQVSALNKYTLLVDGTVILTTAAGRNYADQKFVKALQEAEQLSKSSTDNNTNIIRLFASCYTRDTKSPLHTILLGYIKADDATLISAMETEYDKQTKQVADIVYKRLLYYSGKTPKVEVLGKSGKIKIETEDQLHIENLNLLFTNNGTLRFAKVLEKSNVFLLFEKMDSICVQNNMGPFTEIMEKPHSDLYAMINGVSGDDISYLNHNRGRIEEILQHKKIRTLYFPYLEYYWIEQKRNQYQNDDSGTLVFCYTPYKENFCMSASPVDSAYIQRAPYDSTVTEFFFKFNTEDSERFSAYTERMSIYRSRIAFFVGEFLFSAPVVQSKIPGGRCTITGVSDDTQLMQILCAIIRCDAYPVKVLLLNP